MMEKHVTHFVHDYELLFLQGQVRRNDYLVAICVGPELSRDVAAHVYARRLLHHLDRSIAAQ
ncbi:MULTISPECIES: hypothetical protein [unclassified Rhodococcus (in: high G+C Gram-positive bacteria)]|jgi:hypothetical protein|uniref:hypothetical protein n=1 Tax=unclassified Rhodococcus (in: high G+C Gram-positive bacteria) TaxID=192944 RepID=UPI0021BE52D1|nr:MULTISPECIES: hypothetical protein [unclassified Rhodococcus (in: high G+C Gram-positive bacteria)]